MALIFFSCFFFFFCLLSHYICCTYLLYAPLALLYFMCEKILNILLNEGAHVIEFDFSIAENGWYFFEVGVKMIWYMNVHFQQSKKIIIEHGIEYGGFFGHPTILAIEGWLLLSNKLLQFKVQFLLWLEFMFPYDPHTVTFGTIYFSLVSVCIFLSLPRLSWSFLLSEHQWK